MNDESHLTNLQKIMFEKGEDVASLSSEIQNTFYQEIADNIFFMPSLYSNGFKFKYMLWNYPNLKPDIKSKFGDNIISKLKAFVRKSKDAPPIETSVPKIPDTIKPVSEEQAPVKFSVKENAVKNAVIKKTPPPKPTPKKTPIPKPISNKTAPKKKAAAVSSTKTIVPNNKIQAKKKTLKNDVEDLSKAMKALEGKIEKMMKTFDSIIVKETSKTKSSVKKKTTKKAIKKSNAKLTDTDKVIKIISRRKKSGIDISTLSERTGLNPQKIRNIVYRALKNSLIKRIATGLYAGL